MSCANVEHCGSHSPPMQTIETSSGTALLPGLGSFYSLPGCKNQTAAWPTEGALKRLPEDFRSLPLTLSPQIRASPLLAAHQALDGVLPSCAAGRLAAHKARDTAAIEQSVPLPPFVAWPGFPGPGTPCTPVTAPDERCCCTAAAWCGVPEGHHSPD